MTVSDEKIKVFLIDDDDIDREAVMRFIRREDLPYTLTIAGSEPEALEILKTESFDVILLDYDLRTTTGIELLPYVGNTPVVIVTGSGTEEIAVEAIRKGASDYLIKDPDRNYLTVLPLTIRNVLERKKAETALRENEARFRALTEKVHDLAVIIDKNGCFTYASPSSIILGYARQELVGKDSRDFVHPEDFHLMKKSLDLATEMPYKAVRLHEVRMRHKKGSWILFEGLLTAMFDEPGVNGIVFNGRDITQRKHIEDALDESEEKLRTTLSSISDIVFGLDQNGVFIDYHLPSHLSDIYASPEALLGKCYKNVFPPHLVDLFRTAIDQAVVTGKIQRIDYPLEIATETLWFEARVSTRTNSRGEFKGVTVVARNITDRKQAEEALKKAHDELELRVEERTAELKEANEHLKQEISHRKKSEDALRASEERLYKFMNSATEPFFLLDEHLNFMTINRQGLKFLRRNRADVIGKNLADVWPESKQSGRYDQHRNVIRTGEPFTLKEFTAPPEWGEFRGILKSFKVGDGLGIMLIDTTESKKLEEQLRQSQKMEAIGSLAGGIAHDFNNILGVIMGYTYLAVDDVPEESTTRDNLDHVLAAADRAKELVGQILTFSRKEEKKRRPVFLSKIVQEVLGLLRSTLPTTIDIRSNIEKSLNPVLANTTQIHQVIMNICTNASHAMREEGGILEITLKEIDFDPSTINREDLEPGPYQKLTFSDTGYGISAQVLNRIFEPYYTTKKKGEGTGMGLAVVHGIVKSHGGEITVYSEPGNGTTFHVFFPVTQKKSRVNIPRTERLEGGNEQILLVDDEQSLMEMWKQMLEKLGYKVTAETVAARALELFRAAPDSFDIVVTDQTMPQITGLQLTEEIRKIKPNIPVVLCTGFSESINEKNYKDYNIDAFLIKPVQKTEFATVIRKVLKGDQK